MKVKALKDLFRSEVDDEYAPYLWSDTEFFAYLNEAQDLFVRKIGGIADRRSALTKISYKTGDQFKKYDTRILRIKGARTDGDRIVGIKNLDNMDDVWSDDDYGQRHSTGLDDTKTGPLAYLITDVEQHEMQLYPKPDEDGQLQLFVYRRPLNEIENCDTELEVDSQYHIPLLCWVKYRAYMKQDAETFDRAKAAEFRSAFNDDVAQAKTDKSAREDRKRIVSYGGIPMK